MPQSTTVLGTACYTLLDTCADAVLHTYLRVSLCGVLLQIYGKAEFLNPGGSVKDRVAAQIVSEALSCGVLQPGGLITEGTAGSTGVSLAMVNKYTKHNTTKQSLSYPTYSNMLPICVCK